MASVRERLMEAKARSASNATASNIDIIIKKNDDNGFDVYFPYSLLDSFKEAFKSAKWNPSQKCWKVGPRGEKRLEQWKEIVMPVAIEAQQSAQENDSAELTESEICKIQNALSEIYSEIKRVASKRSVYEQAKAILSENQKKLEEAKALLVEEKSQMKAAYSDAKELLSQVVDVKGVLDEQQVMISNFKRVGAGARDKYEAAQTKIHEAHKKLNSLGYKSKGMYLLQHMNFNRPDRDIPADVTLEVIYTLSEYESA